jgi:hypothetical protein|tara:strand:- start:104 stop:388 length:285 start_codon:yes stop_codon:yes gene_type:complete
MTLDALLKTIQDILEGPRATSHGDFAVNLTRAAELWTPVLKNGPVTADKVALCMALLKVARDEVGGFDKDHYIDGAAYMILWALLKSRKEDLSD